MCMCASFRFVFFFFNDTATTEIYTLSLHDALPICWTPRTSPATGFPNWWHSPVAVTSPAHRASHPDPVPGTSSSRSPDRKSTRLNSSHLVISYAVFCLKKKNITPRRPHSLYHTRHF